MAPQPVGQWIKVTFLQRNGTTGPSIMIEPDETEAVARGRICALPDDAPRMLKARIEDLLEKLLPGYKGTFDFVLPMQDLLSHLRNIDSNDDEERPENLYVRLSNPFLGTPPPCGNNVTSNAPRKRSRSDSPVEEEFHFHPGVGRSTEFTVRPGGGVTCGVPMNPGAGNDTPSKKSRKDVGQTDQGDPMDSHTGLISKHLYDCHIEIAMSVYCDWLDNVTPKHPGHLVIVGNPGVGKTTAAWTLAKLLAESGIVRSENVVEAHRDDLIDRYVGGTEMKTNIVIHSARGGVVIFDEIYALDKPSSPNDSGKEALTTIMKYMTKEAAPVFMFLGYKKQMTDFVNMNPGLQRWIQRWIKYTIEIQDCNPSSLAQIAKIKIEEMELQLEEGIDLEPYFQGLRPQYLQLRNASVAVSFVTHALSHARKRTLELPPAQRKGATRIIRREDLEAALTIINEESKRNGGSDDDYGHIFI